MSAPAARQAGAILFAAWPDLAPATSAQIPGSLTPLLGKALLQRALERLVEYGLRQIDVVVGDNAGAVRQLLGDGAAWGCRLAYHYLPPPAQQARGLASYLRSLGVQPDACYWLADASCLPRAALAAHALPACGGQLSWRSGGRRHWSGWGCFPGRWLLAPQRPLARAALARQVLDDRLLACRLIAPPLASGNAAALLQASRQLLGAARAARIQRNCQLHPSARIVGPAWIGAHVHIGAGAVVGPYAVVGDGSFIDCDTLVRDALILPDTFLGAGLEVRHALVAGNQLHSVAHGCVSAVREPWLLADLARAPARRTLERALAGLLRVLLAPLGAWAARRPGAWSNHLRHSFLPGLAQVWRGQLRLAGPPSGTPGSAPGLLHEALLLAPAERDAATDLASTLLAAAQQNDWRYSTGLLARYLACVLREVGRGARARRRHAAPDHSTARRKA